MGSADPAARGSLLVKGGEVVNADGRQRADVLAIEGRIEALGADLEAPAGVNVVDAFGRFVLPGGIDAHTHFDGRFMGADTADDFAGGGACAVSGGITTHLDMCIPKAGEPPAAAVARWHEKAEGGAICDYGLHVAVVDPSVTSADQLARLVNEGYPSFKLFTAYEELALDDGAVLDVMDVCAEHGAIPVVHAENLHAIDRRTRRLLELGRREPRWHPWARPAGAEGEATARVIALAELAGAPVYVAHVTCRLALRAIAAAQARGQEVYGETEPHYLALTESVYDAPPAEAARYLCSPPIRSSEDQRALYDALRSGTLTGVASDHAPISLADRFRIGADDFSRMPNGVGAIEFVLPVLWTTGVRGGLISPERFVELTATAPAKTFGLDAKGRVAVGLDADLVVWDPDETWTASQAASRSAVDYCVLEGVELTGRAMYTVRRGELVWDGEQVTARPGGGRFIARSHGN